MTNPAHHVGRSRRPVSAIAVTAVAALIALTGCGTSSGGGTNPAASVPPHTELSDAFGALEKGSALQVSLHLGLSSSQLMAESKQEHDSLTPAQASKITSAQLVVDDIAPNGQTLGTAAKSNTASLLTKNTFRLQVLDGGRPYLTFEVVHGTFYLQVDVRGAFALFGQPASAFTRLQQQTKTLPAFAQALINGKFVSMTYQTAQTLGGLIAGAVPNGQSLPTTTQQHQFVAKLQQILAKDITTTRVSRGTSDHLQSSGNTRTLFTDVSHAFATVSPEFGQLFAHASPQAVPSKRITVGSTVTGGVLSQLSFDVGQFSPPNHHVSLPLILDFSQHPPTVSAPTGAVTVNGSQLGQLLRSALMPGGSV